MFALNVFQQSLPLVRRVVIAVSGGGFKHSKDWIVWVDTGSVCPEQLVI